MIPLFASLLIVYLPFEDVLLHCLKILIYSEFQIVVLSSVFFQFHNQFVQRESTLEVMKNRVNLQEIKNGSLNPVPNWDCVKFDASEFAI